MILDELIEKLLALPEWAKRERVICVGGDMIDRNIEHVELDLLKVEVNFGPGPGVRILTTGKSL